MEESIQYRIETAFFLKEQSEAAKDMAASAKVLEAFLREYAAMLGAVIQIIPEGNRGDMVTAPDEFTSDGLEPEAELTLLKKNLPRLLWRIYQDGQVPKEILFFLHGNQLLCTFVRNSFHSLLLGVITQKIKNPLKNTYPLQRVLQGWKNKLSSVGNAKKIADSIYFDAEWYTRTNVDVDIADPALHYLLKGWREGREPGPLFSGNTYLKANPDVLAAQFNPLLHYIEHGKEEGRPYFTEHIIAHDIFYWSNFFRLAQDLTIFRKAESFKAIQKKAQVYLGLCREGRVKTSRIAVHFTTDSPNELRHVTPCNYHYLVLKNGVVEHGRRPKEVGSPLSEFCHESIDIYIENYHSIQVSQYKLDSAQAHSLEQLLQYLTTLYPDAKVIASNSLAPNTSYLQFNIAQWWENIQKSRKNKPDKLCTVLPPLPGQARADIAKLRSQPPATTAFMVLRRGQMPPCCRIRWTWTAWEDISPHIKNAVVFLEDSLFWAHRGLLFRRQARLFMQYLLYYKTSGGSTITQQVAKNLYLSPERSVVRKLKEALLSIRLEQELSKKRILEIYLNIAEWGAGIFGIAEASQFYFNRTPAELSAAQAAQLAVLLPAPLTYTPNMPYLQDKILSTTHRLEQGYLPVHLPQEVKEEFRAQHYHPLS